MYFIYLRVLGLSKGEWGSNENAIILNAIKVFQAKLLAIKRKKLTSHQEIIKLAVMLVLSEIFHVFESRIACTETCQKYSVTVIFYYIFHIKPQFFKTLFQSQFSFDFDEIFTNRNENVRSFLWLFSNIFWEYRF